MAAGQRSAGRNSADSGSARRSTARSARAAAWRTSTRFDVTPMSRLARAPARSSPRHVGRPSVATVARCSGKDTIRRSRSSWSALASATTRPSQGWGIWWSVPFIHSSGPTSRSPHCRPNPSRAATKALASSGNAEPFPYPWGRYSARTDEPSGACHQKPLRSTAAGTPLHTTACSKPNAGQDLGHLRDVTEHVGQVADRHGAAEPVGHPQAPLQVADQGLARHQELVGERVPRPDRDPAAANQPPERLLGLRPHRQVVVHDRQLPVQQEPGVRRVVLHLGDQAVQQVDQPQAEGLERPVPLPIPVGVGDDVDPATCTLTCGNCIGRSSHETPSVLSSLSSLGSEAGPLSHGGVSAWSAM